MTLTTKDRTLVFKFMAWDAYPVRGRLTPVIDLANPGLVTVETVVVDIRLVLPVMKQEVHVSHLEVNVFWTPVRTFALRVQGSAGKSKHNDNQQSHSLHG